MNQEQICGDCIHFGIIEITGYVFDGCKIKEEIVNENAFCKFDPSRFKPSHGEACGETIEPKDKEEE